jgi:hypothetical protein
MAPAYAEPVFSPCAPHSGARQAKRDAADAVTALLQVLGSETRVLGTAASSKADQCLG